MPDERWAPLPGWEEFYEISDHGRVRSLPRVDSLGRNWPGRIRKLGYHPAGYWLIGLRGGGKATTKLVHSLVLTAFVGPRPEGLNACHNDGDPSNNHVDNLRWDTQSSNLLDAVQHGTHRLAAATHCVNGHEFSAENTRIDKAGHRSCRECARLKARAHHDRTYTPSPRGYGPTRTHCPQGHEYTPENTAIHAKNGGRTCKTCRYEKQVTRRNRLRAAGLPVT